MDKRDFIKTLTLGSISWSISSRDIPNWHNENDSEKFWQKVRDDYNLVPDYINLESGYYNIIPKPTLNALHNHIDKVNRLGSMYMRKFKEKEKASINKKLSQIVGCSSKNLILTRNTTESLNSVIKGLNWVEGDNIIFANQDYGAMQQMIHQTAERFKLSTTILDVPNHPEDDDEIVSLYEKSISKSTKLILVSHMVNITGQILPIKKICNMAHNYGVQVLVDGAHCIGHFTFSIDELNCDYYGSSLHKWLAAPLGCGILYINEKHHKDLWPLFTRNSSLEDGIERFGHTGTHPAYHDISSRAIGYGKHIRIDHGYGYLTLYAHLNSYNVRRGQKVKKGDIIGFVGNTGRSKGVHLHYEVHKDGKKVNPVNYFYSNLTPEEFDEILKISSQENQSLD